MKENTRAKPGRNIAGLWRNRNTAAENAPMVVHAMTTAGSRYLGLAANHSREATPNGSGGSRRGSDRSLDVTFGEIVFNEGGQTCTRDFPGSD
jgi:hypothetical protein